MSSSWASLVRSGDDHEDRARDDSERRAADERFSRCMRRPGSCVAVVDTNALIHGVDLSFGFLLRRLREEEGEDGARGRGGGAGAGGGADGGEDAQAPPEVSAVTVPQVAAEVRDRALRQRLEALAVGILPQEPAAESVRLVQRVAQQTGDIASLSAPDIALLALAHTLEVRKHGGARIRTSVANVPTAARGKGAEGGRALPGWGSVDNPEDWVEVDQADSDDDGDGGGGAAAAAAAHSRVARVASSLLPADGGEGGGGGAGAGEGGGGGEGGGEVASPASPDEGGGDDWETAAGKKAKLKKGRRMRREASRKREEEERAEREEKAAAALERMFVAAGGAGPAGDAGDAEDGGGPVPPSTVCLLTHDFPMQNVALHMGLKLVTVDGRRIRSKRYYVLKCTACFAVTRSTTKLFCGKCGNQSLVKATVSVGEDGVEHLGMPRRQNIRGTRFPLPAPKGGRNSSDVITSEDQLMEVERKMRGGGFNKSVASSMFADSEVLEEFGIKGGKGSAASSSALPATLMASGMLGGGRKNPNERVVHKKRR